MSRQPHRQPTRIEDYRPAGNQFTLRGLFIFMTASCVILAILALVMKEASHWLGALLVPLMCFVIIAAIELGRRLFPPKPSFQYYLPPVPQNPMQTAYFGDGDSPFSPSKNYFSERYGNNPFSEPRPTSAAKEQPPLGEQDPKRTESTE
jgi:hypothetical protein